MRERKSRFLMLLIGRLSPMPKKIDKSVSPPLHGILLDCESIGQASTSHGRGSYMCVWELRTTVIPIDAIRYGWYPSLAGDASASLQFAWAGQNDANVLTPLVLPHLSTLGLSCGTKTTPPFASFPSCFHGRRVSYENWKPHLRVRFPPPPPSYVLVL